VSDVDARESDAMRSMDVLCDDVVMRFIQGEYQQRCVSCRDAFE